MINCMEQQPSISSSVSDIIMLLFVYIYSMISFACARDGTVCRYISEFPFWFQRRHIHSTVRNFLDSGYMHFFQSADIKL